MIMKKTKFVAMVLVLFLILEGVLSCSGSNQEKIESMELASTDATLLYGSWEMVSYEIGEKSFSVSGMMIFDNSQFGIIYTIMEDDKAKSGRGHAGSYTIKNDVIDFTIPLSAEFMDGKAMVAEKSLTVRAHYEVVDDFLVLTFDSGSVQKFNRTKLAPKTSLTGGWEMVGYEGGGSIGPASGRIFFHKNRFVFIYTMEQKDHPLAGRAHGGTFQINKDALILELLWFIQYISGKGAVSPTVFKREAHYTLSDDMLTITYDNNNAIQKFRLIQ